MEFIKSKLSKLKTGLVLFLFVVLFLSFYTHVSKAQGGHSIEDVDWEIASCTSSTLTAKYPGIKGTLDKPTDFFSNAIGETVGYAIYLPPSYNTNPTKRYPVVYYLHGSGGSECNYFGNNVEAAPHFSDNDMVDLVERGDIPETIFVAINGGRGLNYPDIVESMFIGEMIPHIDNRYRTIASREGRALEGFSMGGLGTAKFLFNNPDKFCAGTIMAGANIGVDMSSFMFSNVSGIIGNQLKVKGLVGNDQTRSAMDGLFGSGGDIDQFISQNGYNPRHEYITLNVGHNAQQLIEIEGVRNGQFYWSCFEGAVITPPPVTNIPTLPPGGSQGDTDGDGDTDIIDQENVLGNFGKTTSSANLDGKGVVGVFDYNILNIEY